MKKVALIIAVSFALSIPGFSSTHRSSSMHSGTATATHHRATTTTTHDHPYYTNRSGHRVHTPVQSKSTPAGATAKCGDGTYSFSDHHPGTCSHHGGVSSWLAH